MILALAADSSSGISSRTRLTTLRVEAPAPAGIIVSRTSVPFGPANELHGLVEAHIHHIHRRLIALRHRHDAVAYP